MESELEVFLNIKILDQGLNTSHNFLLSILVEHGLIGIFFVFLFALILILKMKSWTGIHFDNDISINIDF